MKKSLPLVSCAILLAAFMSGCNSSSKKSGPTEQKIAVITGSNVSTTLITQSGQVLGAGNSFSGALGLGTDNTKDFTTFTHVPVFSFDNVNVLATAKNTYSPGAADSSSMSVSTANELFVAGTNANGQLGTGKLTDVLGSYTETTIKDASGNILLIQDAQGSNNFGLLLTKDGYLYGTGTRRSGANTYNEFGDNAQLGGATDPIINGWTPISVKDGQTAVTFVSMAASNYSGYYVQSGGQLWVAGDNARCQLGVADCAGHTIVPAITKSPFAGKVKMVAAGEDAAALIDSNGDLWVVGDNTAGHIASAAVARVEAFTKLNVVDAAGNPVRFIDVSISATGIAALSVDGMLYVSGVNVPAGAPGYTILGLPAGTASVTALTPVAIQDNGKAVVLTHIHTVGNHTIVSDQNGNLWVVGQNTNGQLGTGNKTDVAVFTKVPAIVL